MLDFLLNAGLIEEMGSCTLDAITVEPWMISLIFLGVWHRHSYGSKHTPRICPRNDLVAATLPVLEYRADYSIAANSSSSGTVANFVAESLIA